MTTFNTAAPRGIVIDDLVTTELLQVARDLATEQDSFRTRILVSRGLGARPGESTPPKAQRVRSLTPIPKVDMGLDDDLARALERAIRQLKPQVRRVARPTLSMFALEDGVTLRLDLATDPALPNDVILTFLCGVGGAAEATLRVWSGPLTGCGQPRTPVVVPLKERQAVLIPALWPAEMCPRFNPKSQGERLLAVVGLVRVESS